MSIVLLPRNLRIFLIVVFAFTILFKSYSQPLNGTYTIGNASADYTTLTAAVDDLNNEGVNGPVVMNILPGTYNEQIMLYEINGASSTNTITFQSSTLDSSSVKLFYFITNNNMNYVIRLNGTDYIKFRHMTIESDGVQSLRGIFINNGATNVSFSNNHFIANTTSTNLNKEFFYMNENNNNDLIIENNVFESGGKTICLGNQGNLNSSQNIQIKNNEFKNGGGGIYLYYLKDVVFSGNTKTNSKSIYVDYCSGNTLFSQNDIYFSYPNSEIRFDHVNENSLGSFTIKNNCINGTSRFLSCSDVYFVNNTIQAVNCLYFGGGSNYELLNNVFLSLDNEQSEIIRASIFQVSEINSNHNLFYSLDDGYFSIIGHYKYDLETWRDSTGNDINSLFDLPTLISNQDFRSNNSLALNENAIPLPSVNVDIDGDLRDPLTPDLGADEFEIDSSTYHNLELLSISSPDTSVCSEPDSLSISIINHSVFDIDSLVVMWWLYDELQDSSHYVINIPSSDTVNLFLENLVFNERTLYEIHVQTFLPNGEVDNYNYDNRKTLNYFHLGLIQIHQIEDIYCQQDHILFVNPPPNCTVIWSTGETTEKISVSSPGVYNVTVTDPWGCSSSESITIN
tara:strand:+ start:157945 stop:159816 length:1872 start_codon:yes stop_codon:yes gene_type:complete